MPKHYPIAGSERRHSPDVVQVGSPQEGESIEVSVYLRRPALDGPLAALASQAPADARRRHLSRTEIADRFGADAADIAKVLAFAQEYGLRAVAVDSAKGMVKLAGTPRRLAAAFGVELGLFRKGGREFRSHVGPVSVPEALKEIVTVVMGLDNHPLVRRLSAPRAADSPAPEPGAIARYTASQVAEIYRFPQPFAGEGQCLGIIELGAGFFESDLDGYFAALGIPKPEIVVVGPNDPGTPEQPNHGYGEVVMDIEVAGAVVPKAKLAVYFATENSQKGFMEVMQEAIHDEVNRPQVLSVSWGESEVEWTQAAAAQMREIIRVGALLGVTVCVASGDDGASDGLPDGKLSVDFPGSVPEALCCGGTRLVAEDGVICSEVAWNDPQWQLATGGGVSFHFQLPPYQLGAAVPPLPAAGAFGGREAGFAGRGVPDVAGNADPLTGYELFILGKWYVDGGTSAVAPLWAALVTRLNQAIGQPAGFINPWLYRLSPSACFRDITEGDNNHYAACVGWDACTGCGSPCGTELLAALSGDAEQRERGTDGE